MAVDSEALMQAQRSLRSRLLDKQHSISWRPGRDLAAELLLYLDEPERCWRLGARWLRERLDADRVDAGYASPAQLIYRPLAEDLREGRPVPSVVGASIDVADRSVAAVWRARCATVYEDVAQDRRFGSALRAQLRAKGTQAKLAVALYDDGHPVGLLCADWLDLRRRWDAESCEQLGRLGIEVLGPVLAAARLLAGDGAASRQPASGVPLCVPALRPERAVAAPLSALTPAELRTARMVATGMSYKEVARRIDRSFSTVDHQLRSIRDKLGVHSTAQLVHLLSSQLVDSQAQ